MAVPAVTNTFVTNTTASATEVNTNFSDLVTYLTNRNDGSSVWDRILVTSASAVPLIVNNSTGTTNIANFQDNGSNVFQIVDGGDVYMNATKKFYLDSGSNTYIYEVSADQIDLVAGGSPGFFVVATGAGVMAADKLWLDSGGNTYLIEGINDEVRLFCGGVQNLAATATIFSLQATIDFSIASTKKLYFDGGLDTYMLESSANDISFFAGGTFVVSLTATNFSPVGTGLVSSGTASDYWNDISYKTLTDRGCLGYFDEGVELQDGRKVSDTEALLAIEKHPTKKTIYGTDMLDYRTFPKISYKKAEDKYGNVLPRDVNNEAIGGADGIEMTSMFSIFIGALKEITNRVKALESNPK